MERLLESTTTIPAAFARSRQVRERDPGRVIADVGTPEARRSNSLSPQISLATAAGAGVHQEVSIQLGDARITERSYAQPISWRAIGHERLFPTFDGALELSPAVDGSVLRVAGTYTVPLGAAGRFGDGVIGHRVARRALETFVDLLGRRLQAAVERQLESSKGDEGERRATDTGQNHSEIYVG
jgi:hypothetical protein